MDRGTNICRLLPQVVSVFVFEISVEPKSVKMRRSELRRRPSRSSRKSEGEWISESALLRWKLIKENRFSGNSGAERAEKRSFLAKRNLGFSQLASLRDKLFPKNGESTQKCLCYAFFFLAFSSALRSWTVSLLLSSRAYSGTRLLLVHFIPFPKSAQLSLAAQQKLFPFHSLDMVTLNAIHRHTFQFIVARNRDSHRHQQQRCGTARRRVSSFYKYIPCRKSERHRLRGAGAQFGWGTEREREVEDEVVGGRRKAMKFPIFLFYCVLFGSYFSVTADDDNDDDEKADEKEVVGLWVDKWMDGWRWYWNGEGRADFSADVISTRDTASEFQWFIALS